MATIATIALGGSQTEVIVFSSISIAVAGLFILSLLVCAGLGAVGAIGGWIEQRKRRMEGNEAAPPVSPVVNPRAENDASNKEEDIAKEPL